ncbi:MAG: hypothetical protein DRP82_07815 [Planctomycetota bacterium]|nr:MAG: hypothetical protein DRP82_07815 [Planctomycetota bacterium]
MSGQPTWLTIDASTGELSGTPPAGSAGNTYTFTVEVTDGQQTASKQFDLEVKVPPPRADFEASPTYGTAPLTVNFTDRSTGNPTSWGWDFDGDGVVDSTNQNPSWTYNNPGWYTVKLTVSNGTNSDTCVREMYILVASNVYYVDGMNGDDGNGGTDWGDAWKTIGKALSVAGDYDLVLVADATYNETGLGFSGKKIYLKGVDHNTAGAQPVIDCQSSGNAFLFSSGETGDSVVDNFTIRNGSTDLGGAIACVSSSPSITNCTFRDNSATYVGGAICCTNSSNPTVTNCVFSGNDADKGGAIACANTSNPSIIDCTFDGNNASTDGGAIYCESSSPNITNCTFSGNSAVNGGGVYCYDSSNPSITNCVFSSNSATFGGAIYCEKISAPIMTNCLFSGNSASSEGGVILCWESGSPSIINCTFSGNSAGRYAGVISCYDTNPTFSNCILWGNSALLGGDEIHADSGSTITLNYCCAAKSGYSGSGTIDDSNNCIHDDPQFVDPANGDYHLKDTSPCIDAGDNSLVPSGVDKDLDGNPRIVNGTVDIGAYEKQ